MPTISAPAACIRTCRRTLVDDIYEFCEHFPKMLDDIEGLLTDNRIFKQRNVDIGVITRADARSLGHVRRDAALDGRGMGFAPQRSLMSATTNSISRFRSARTATITTAI